MLLRHADGVARDAIIEHSKFCTEGTRCSAVHHAGRGVWLCDCVVSGVIAESLLFPPVTVNNSKQWQPRWSSCLQLQLINIEEQMLKLQMLKHRRQRKRLRRWSVRPAEAERVNLQHCSPTEGPGRTNALWILSDVNGPI